VLAAGETSTAERRGLRRRVVDGFVHRMTGRRMERYADGCRGYSTRLLRRVPFESDSNGRVFDLELLLQALHVGGQIEEVSIAAGAGVGARRAAERVR